MKRLDINFWKNKRLNEFNILKIGIRAMLDISEFSKKSNERERCREKEEYVLNVYISQYCIFSLSTIPLQITTHVRVRCRNTLCKKLFTSWTEMLLYSLR